MAYSYYFRGPKHKDSRYAEGLTLDSRTLSDIFRCPHCAYIAARGNSFCRGCGVRFTRKDLETMEKNICSPVGALPWNTRDRYRCIHCAEFVSIIDHYCRGCGDRIDDSERQLMAVRLAELAKRNSPALVGAAVFVAVVIWVCIEIVR